MWRNHKEKGMKYVAYYRVSTQRQNLGIDAQTFDVHNYVCLNGGKLIAEYTEKESGKNNNRIELNKALDTCKRENATLLIAKLDRLSRNVGFLFTLKDSGITFKALDMPNCNTLTLAIYSGMAQNERELISERTKKALAQKKMQGYKLGSPVAKFTEEMRQKATKEIQRIASENENNKRAMAFIKCLPSAYSYSEIARKLNNGGFRTSKGNMFRAEQVKRLINRLNA